MLENLEEGFALGGEVFGSVREFSSGDLCSGVGAI